MSETAIYGVMANAARGRRAWRKALGVAICAGAALGTVVTGCMLGYLLMLVAR